MGGMLQKDPQKVENAIARRADEKSYIKKGKSGETSRRSNFCDKKKACQKGLKKKERRDFYC